MLLKTERHLNVRSSEHIDISHLTGKSVECKPSVVSDHLLLYNHDSDFLTTSEIIMVSVFFIKRINLNI